MCVCVCVGAGNLGSCKGADSLVSPAESPADEVQLTEPTEQACKGLEELLS